MHIKPYLSPVLFGSLILALDAVFITQKRWDEAETILLKAVSIQKTMRNGNLFYIYLAEVYFMQEKWSESEGDFVQMIEMLEKQEICLNTVLIDKGIAAFQCCGHARNYHSSTRLWLIYTICREIT